MSSRAICAPLPGPGSNSPKKRGGACPHHPGRQEEEPQLYGGSASGFTSTTTIGRQRSLEVGEGIDLAQRRRRSPVRAG